MPWILISVSIITQIGFKGLKVQKTFECYLQHLTRVTAATLKLNVIKKIKINVICTSLYFIGFPLHLLADSILVFFINSFFFLPFTIFLPEKCVYSRRLGPFNPLSFLVQFLLMKHPYDFIKYVLVFCGQFSPLGTAFPEHQPIF